MNTLLIGEAPAKEPGPAFTGRCGNKLATLCGCSLHEFLWRFDRVNLFDEPLNGDPWPHEEAHFRASVLRDYARCHRRVILLGRRVEHAFFTDSSHRPWYSWHDWPHGCICVAPHPSGRSHHWNDPKNVEEARRFWHALR